ncbi:hypothetical protein F4814DRAFT_434240 [Daldinia grandis]|nr:hypothetical protein F4814DRAFT_434240 [Daldinia grandis]
MACGRCTWDFLGGGDGTVTFRFLLTSCGETGVAIWGIFPSDGIAMYSKSNQPTRVAVVGVVNIELLGILYITYRISC